MLESWPTPPVLGAEGRRATQALSTRPRTGPAASCSPSALSSHSLCNAHFACLNETQRFSVLYYVSAPQVGATPGSWWFTGRTVPAARKASLLSTGTRLSPAQEATGLPTQGVLRRRAEGRPPLPAGHTRMLCAPVTHEPCSRQLCHHRPMMKLGCSSSSSSSVPDASSELLDCGSGA